MSPPNASDAASVDRAADRSPALSRTRARTRQQARVMVTTARRLVDEKGTSFSTKELVKEAGVALQTFYRHFESKDHLLLAVFEDVIAEQTAHIEAAVAELPGPVERLHWLIRIALDALRAPESDTRPKFVTSEHWRLHQIFPDEMAQADRPFADIVERELRAAKEQGLLDPPDPAADAWFVMKLVMSVYHHYAFAPADRDVELIAEQLWSFCYHAFRPR